MRPGLARSLHLGVFIQYSRPRRGDCNVTGLRRTFFIAALSFASLPVWAGITAINVGGAGNVPAWNWAQGSNWSVRAILLDGGAQPVGSLSPAASFNTIGQSLFPAYVNVTLDAAAPAGHIIRVYRRTSPFNAGDTGIEYADYNLCPCAAGNVTVDASGYLKNGDFANSSSVLPVVLQSFSVD
jgi:hypothetical protein